MNPIQTPPTLPATRVERRLSIPDDPVIRAAVNGALSILNFQSSWDDSGGGASAEDTAQAMKIMFLDFVRGGNLSIGTIVAYVTTETPPNLLACDGGMYLAADYPALAEVIDPQFLVGELIVTPDLRGRTLIGTGMSDEGSDYNLGDYGGSERITITVDQMPAHAHTTQPHSHSFAQYVPNIDVEGAGVPDPLGAGNPQIPAFTDTATVIVNNTGGSEPHQNMPPYFAVKYGIVWR